MMITPNHTNHLQPPLCCSTWYFSPYPSEFKDCKVGAERESAYTLPHCYPFSAPSLRLISASNNLYLERSSRIIIITSQMLYICEYSLHFFKRRSQLLRHMNKCR